MLSGGAAVIASAATRSAIDGSDFGDSTRAALPSVVGSVIGDFLMGSGDLWNSSDDTLQFADNVGYNNVANDAAPEVVVVYGKRRGWLGSILKAGADATTGAWDDVTSGALQRGIQQWTREVRARASDPQPNYFGTIGRIIAPQTNDPLRSAAATKSANARFGAAMRSETPFERGFAARGLGSNYLDAGLKVMLPTMAGEAADFAIQGIATEGVGALASRVFWCGGTSGRCRRQLA